MKKQINKSQPFVKWVGGKRSLLSKLHELLPEKFNNYYEPFVGGGALFFSLVDKINQATLVDKNLELVLAYKVIKKEPQKLIELLREHSEHHSKDYYYKLRKTKLTDPVHIAARFLYLNKTCFNGLYRVNQKGGFNVPMGQYANPNIIQEDNILVCHQALQKVEIKYGEFENISPQKGDFIYFDPPYHPTSEVSFTEYTKDNFTERDQVRLRDFILSLHKKGVFIMLSNSKTKLIEDIYRAKYFKHHLVYAPRFVNCKPSDRGKVGELIITNY